MRIVQWNSHHGGLRTDGKLDTAGFGRHLLDLKPDVVCLNEVEQLDGYGHDDKVAAWVAALGPGWSGFFANLSGVIGGSGQGNAILCRTADAMNAQPFKLTLFDHRVAVMVIVRGCLIMATHLDNEAQASRVVETVQLLGWLSVQPVTKMIICGDFNAGPTTPEMAPWPALGYVDAWVAAKKSSRASSFLPNGITHGKSSRIDYVFTRGLTVDAVDVPNTGTLSAVFPSDHHPVVVDIKGDA